MPLLSRNDDVIPTCVRYAVPMVIEVLGADLEPSTSGHRRDAVLRGN